MFINNVFQILNCITEDILDHIGSFKNPLDQCDYIKNEIETAGKDQKNEEGEFRNLRKISDIPKICCNHLNFGTKRFYHRVMPPTFADGKRNSEAPDQTSP